MLGKKKYEPKFLYNISLEQLVPEENYYRILDKVLDLNFIYKKCEPLYGTTGNKSIDPVVFFKLNLYGYFENIISDRELIRRVSDSLAARLYLGYDIDEELPWHSTISRTRALMPEGLFEEIFNKVLSMCSEAGLLEGTHQSIDSTLVKANASLEKVERITPKLTLEKYIEKVRKENTIEEKDSSEEEQNKSGEKKQQGANEQLNVIKNSKGIKRTKLSNKNYKSKTDSDSRIAKKPGKPVSLYYTVHYAVDSQARIITEVLSTHSDISDYDSLITVVDRAKRRINQLDKQIESIGADKGYCSGENLEQLESRNIKPYMPTQKHINTTGGLDKKEFIYDQHRDIYLCPDNRELTYKYTSRKNARVYSAGKKGCENCPIKQRCTQGKQQRKIQHSIYRKEYEGLFQRMNSSEGRKMMKIRKSHSEALFAEAKMNHGLSKFLTIGISKSQKKAYIIATVQNLKRLIRYLRTNTRKSFSQLLKDCSHFKEIYCEIKFKLVIQCP